MTSSGLFLIQGDMAMPPDLETKPMALRRLSGEWQDNNWRNGDISYCFAPGSAPEAREAWRLAVASVKDRVPCLSFSEVDAVGANACTRTPSIIVQSVPEDGCWSYVGRVS